MNQLVLIKNVKKRYIKNKVYNLEINKGDFILLTGENGAGKSTLIKLILRFIHPDGGQIKVKNKLKITFLSERINLPVLVNTLDYIKMYYDCNNEYIDYNFLNSLDIPLNRVINKLSKGNKQKLALFITLLNNRDLIILDEPLNGLDTNSIKKIKAKIAELHNKGTSFLISTHLKSTFKSLFNKEYQL